MVALYLAGTLALSAVFARELTAIRRSRPGYVPPVREVVLAVAVVASWPVWVSAFLGAVVIGAVERGAKR